MATRTAKKQYDYHIWANGPDGRAWMHIGWARNLKNAREMKRFKKSDSRANLTHITIYKCEQGTSTYDSDSGTKVY